MEQVQVLYRLNEKGEPGIFQCNECRGTVFYTAGDALIDVINQLNDNDNERPENC